MDSYKSKFGALKKKIKGLVTPPNEFSERIKARHEAFWRDPAQTNVLKIMKAEDPIEEWKSFPNWQRLLSNKHNSREFARKFGCKVPHLYWQGRDYEKLDFSALPEFYVIRPTTGWSANNVFLMNKDFNLFDNRSYTPEEIRGEMAMVLAQKPHLEFLVEEFLTTEEGEHSIPNDYKLFMFNGAVGCIQVINRTGPGTGSNFFYDENWKPIKPVLKNLSLGTPQAPPACLEEMLEAAKTLSREYRNFVRIDFYATHRGAVFGEFTPTPAKGGGVTPYGSKLLIDKWDRHCKDLI